MSDPVIDIIQTFKLLLTKHDSKAPISATYTKTILSTLRTIFSSKAVSKVFTYLCLHGASTAWILQCRLEMTEPTTYRSLKQLRTIGVITSALKIDSGKQSKGGPRPTVWVIEGSSPEDIDEALKVHYLMLSPKYRIAEKGAQKILDEIHDLGRPLEINYSDIMDQVKELKSSFTTPDIADLVAQYLQEKGIKIWR